MAMDRIKDFESLLPGHGGMMDRFDCQVSDAPATLPAHHSCSIAVRGRAAACARAARPATL